MPCGYPMDNGSRRACLFVDRGRYRLQQWRLVLRRVSHPELENTGCFRLLSTVGGDAADAVAVLFARALTCPVSEPVSVRSIHIYWCVLRLGPFARCLDSAGDCGGRNRLEPYLLPIPAAVAIGVLSCRARLGILLWHFRTRP